MELVSSTSIEEHRATHASPPMSTLLTEGVERPMVIRRLNVPTVSVTANEKLRRTQAVPNWSAYIQHPTPVKSPEMVGSSLGSYPASRR